MRDKGDVIASSQSLQKSMKSFRVQKMHVIPQAEDQAKCVGTYSRHLDSGTEREREIKRKEKKLRNVTRKPQSIIFYIVYTPLDLESNTPFISKREHLHSGHSHKYRENGLYTMYFTSLSVTTSTSLTQPNDFIPKCPKPKEKEEEMQDCTETKEL